MAEATDSDENVQQLLESSEAADSDEGAMNPKVPIVPIAVPFPGMVPNVPVYGGVPFQGMVPNGPVYGGVPFQGMVPFVPEGAAPFPGNPEHGDVVLLPGCCKVPTTLRHLKEEAYTPKVVSIGPFHHGDKRLQDMERHKQIMFERFTQKAGLSRHDLVRFVELHLVSGVRTSYPKTIDLTDTPKLIDMILLDAGFIIEFFMPDGTDAILLQPWLQCSVIYDLLLLENQLPFFVIERLFERAFPKNGSRASLLELLNMCFGYVSEQLQLDPNLDGDIKHFTDLLRELYLQGRKPRRQPTPKDRSHILSYTANALQEAGIKLRENRKSKYLLDLKFSGHILEIPQIVVHDNSELLFRNMIALEQCHYPKHAYITDYVYFLDWLIDSNKDAELLIHKKIVRSYLSDTNNVASLINGLSVNVVESTCNSNIVEICKSLNNYCEDPYHKSVATLRRDYCPTRWKTIASIAAIVIVILTAVGTVFTILQVVK